MADGQWLQHLCGRLDRGEIDSALFLESFTTELAARIGCSRAGVWVFADDAASGRMLRCLAMYDAVQQRMVSAPAIALAEVAAYFAALERDGCVVAPDARTHPALLAFVDGYLRPLDVHSVLDVCFSANGRLFGAFSCEQVGAPVAWTQRQLQALRQIGARASLSLVHAAQVAAQTDTTPGALWSSSTPDRLS